jgi:peptidoglycan-associated lipoprotein
VEVPVTRRAIAGFALIVLSAGLVACGPKRKPELTRTGSGGARPTPSPSAPVPDLPVDAGPDVSPIREDELGAGDVSAGGGPEGSPLADIYFAYDSAQLSDEARAVLDQHARWLQARGDVRISVEGHCDERGTVEYNLALGEQRAQAAREYLASLGVAASRLNLVSYGKERPIDPGHGEEAWAKNRRAHFAIAR